MTPSRGVTLFGTEPRATVPVSFRSPTLGATDGNGERRVSSVPGSVTPRVEGRFFVGLAYGFAYTLPGWIVLYGTVRGVW